MAICCHIWLGRYPICRSCYLASDGPNRGIWFLFALFWARLAASISFKFKSPVICGAACFSLGLLSTRYVMLPFDIQSGLCAAPFVMFGAYARSHKLFERRDFHVIVWPILLSIWCWAILEYNGFSMAMCGYGETTIDLLRNIAGSIASTVCILGALNSLERNRKKRAHRVRCVEIAQLLRANHRLYTVRTYL